MTIATDNPLFGILFAGDGTEVQRTDDMSDFGSGEPVYAGDMDAALVVAQNGFPYLLFEAWEHEGDHDPWKVSAFSDLDDALAATVDIDSTVESFGAKARYFVFDGRTHYPVPDAARETFLRTELAGDGDTPAQALERYYPKGT